MQRSDMVRKKLLDAILDGDLKAGDMLPSLRGMSARFNVALTTVQAVVNDLKREEWLISSPGKGVEVADPLPPVAHLLRLKRKHRAHVNALTMPAASGMPVLKCLIHDEAMLPLFEWAAHEYAAAFAPCDMEFQMRPLGGREDTDALLALDADLVVLPSYAMRRALSITALTPAEGIISDVDKYFAGMPEPVARLATHAGRHWGMPLFVGGAVLTAGDDMCRGFGIEPAELVSVSALLRSLRAALAGTDWHNGDKRVFNFTFLFPLLLAAGHVFPGIAHAAEFCGRPGVRSLLEEMRALAGNSGILLERFDRWERCDFSNLAIRHQPANLFCRNPMHHRGSRILPIPDQDVSSLPFSSFCMCVTARSVHVFEAWEWAVHLGQTPFQRKLAESACEVPIGAAPEVWRALGDIISPQNAAVLRGLLERIAPFNGVGGEDVMAFSWEVLGNELFRFISGQNDYDQMLARLRVKSERFVQKQMRESNVADGVSVIAGNVSQPNQPADSQVWSVSAG